MPAAAVSRLPLPIGMVMLMVMLTVMLIVITMLMLMLMLTNQKTSPPGKEKTSPHRTVFSRPGAVL